MLGAALHGVRDFYLYRMHGWPQVIEHGENARDATEIKMELLYHQWKVERHQWSVLSTDSLLYKVHGTCTEPVPRPRARISLPQNGNARMLHEPLQECRRLQSQGRKQRMYVAIDPHSNKLLLHIDGSGKPVDSSLCRSLHISNRRYILLLLRRSLGFFERFF